MEQARRTPLGGQFIGLRYFIHGFTIQLATSRVKRAATAVRPPVYCRATTEASASSVPSEFWSRSISANSTGRVEANSTSRDVPNSMTVLSLKALPSLPTRVKRTGIRTGLASGKNFASLAVELSRAERAVATASLGTDTSISVVNNFGRRGLGPWACRLAGEGTRTASESGSARAQP